MDLEREPDPQPAPAATGAVSELKKQQVITAAAIGFALLMAMLLTWAWIALHRPPVKQKVAAQSSAASTQKNLSQRDLDEAKEKAYEDGRRTATNSNSAFNTGSGAGVSTAGTQEQVTEKKRTPQDDYNDLLAKAALADSAVPGGFEQAKGGRTEKEVNRSSEGVADREADDSNKQPNHEETQHKMQAIGQNVIPAGTFIDCALVNKLDGDNVGPVKLQVSTDVYNPQTLDLAIPQGSIFLGEAQKVSGQFQQRLAVSFDRLQVRRDGKLYEITLDKIPGLDQQGATALKDKVNNHYLQIFGASLAIGAIGGLAQIGSGSYGGYNGIDTGVQIRNGISQSMAENAAQVLNRFLMRLPSVVIGPGTPAVVYIPFGVDLS